MTAARHASPRRPSIGLAIGFAIMGFTSSPIALADPISKEQCVDAHSRGQDARDAGKLSLARKLFLTCAQTACPGLIQGDCARFADDLGRQQSSLTFVARDAQGTDLPDTAVYVDDSLIVTRLDDGKAHDVDPGRHTIRFTNGGKEQVVTLVVGTGEKGRAVVATFGSLNAPSPAGGASPGASGRPMDLVAEPRTIRPTGAKVLIVGGAVAIVAGGLLSWSGYSKVPDSCSISTTKCKAAPGDPVFDDAKSGVKRLNIGIATGAVGIVALGSGVFWYVTGSHVETEGDGKIVMPILTRDSAGLALSGTF